MEKKKNKFITIVRKWFKENGKGKYHLEARGDMLVIYKVYPPKKE